MKRRSVYSIMFCLVVLAAAGRTSAQNFDISSGGLPTITGAVGGSVVGSASVLNNLVVTINFGEVSPANTNSIIKVVVPIAVRSSAAYKVVVTVSGATSPNAQAIQRTDIGFGANNFRSLGSNARVCTRSIHRFYTPFNNDPSVGVTLNASGRVTYSSSLNNIGASTVILSGPRLTSGGVTRQTNNGYVFDAIITLTPQFFAAGTTTQTLTFTISSGPTAPC